MLLGLYLASIFGVYYRQLTSLPFSIFYFILFFGDSADDMTVFVTTTTPIFLETYHQSGIIVGLHVGTIGIGLFGASPINAWFMDWIYAYLKGKNEGVGEPEFRLRKLFLLL